MLHSDDENRTVETLMDTVVYILHALYMHAVICLITLNTVAVCSDRYMKNLNAFGTRDIKILNVKPCDNVITTETLMVNYLFTFARILR
jgi:hypothetical protein